MLEYVQHLLKQISKYLHHCSSHRPSHRKPPGINLPRLPRRFKRPIPQPPQRLRRALPRPNPRHIMAAQAHVLGRRMVIRPLEADLVGDQLIVQARHGERFRRRRAAVEHVPQVLDRGGDDAAAARGADDEVEGAVGVLDDGGGDGREGAFARADVVCWGGDVAEGVGGARGGEVLGLAGW
jgi:hypothetical protein